MKICLRFKTLTKLKSLVENVLQLVGQLGTTNAANHREIMSKLEEITATISGMQTTLNACQTAAVAAVNEIKTLTPTDAQLGTLNDALTSLNNGFAATAQMLNDAVNPPTPTPTPTPTPAV